MRISRLSAVIALATVVGMLNPISADTEETAKSPLAPVGAWVKYHVVGEQNSGTENAYEETIEWQETEADAQGRNCHWIESRIVIGEEKNTLVTRLLVPEEALLDDPNPLRQTVKMQRSENGKPPTEMPLYFAPLYSYIVLNCPGIESKMEPLNESKIVKYQQGDLSINEKKTSSIQWSRQLQTANITQHTSVDSEFYSHPDAPAGVAEAVVKVTIKFDGQERTAKLIYRLIDTGNREIAR